MSIDGFRWIQNPNQRKKRGGKPAVLVNVQKFNVIELTPNVIDVPVDVEIVWALLTPKNGSLSYLLFQLQGTYIVGTRQHSSSTKDPAPTRKWAHPKVVDSSNAVGAARMHVPPTS